MIIKNKDIAPDISFWLIEKYESVLYIKEEK